MPPPPDWLVGVRSKIERAEQHLRDLESAVRTFVGDLPHAFGHDPYEVGTKFDPRTGQKVYYMTRVDPVPPYVGGIAGDALHNLRSALDHLAVQLWLTGAKLGDERDVSYPVIDTADPARYKSARAGKVQGLGQDAIDLIDATEPYEGGVGHQLWVLHKLDNIDKYRRLNMVGVQFGGLWADPDFVRHMKARAKADPSIVGRSPPGYWFRPESRQDALKVGDELARCPPEVNIEDRTEFTFDVAIDEPGVIRGETAIELVHQLTHLVDGIVDRFAPLL
jgi:hypothetical protein